MDSFIYQPVARGEFQLVDEPIDTPELTYEELERLVERFPAPREWWDE